MKKIFTSLISSLSALVVSLSTIPQVSFAETEFWEGADFWDHELDGIWQDDELDKIVKGDCNFDESITIADVVFLEKLLLTEIKIDTRYQWYICDMNDDDRLNVYDLVLLKKLVISQSENDSQSENGS